MPAGREQPGRDPGAAWPPARPRRQLRRRVIAGASAEVRLVGWVGPSNHSQPGGCRSDGSLRSYSLQERKPASLTGRAGREERAAGVARRGRHGEVVGLDAAGVGVALPAVAPALVVPPVVEAVVVDRAVLGDPHHVRGRVVVVGGVVQLRRVHLVAERGRHPELHGAVAPVVVDPVVVGRVEVAARDQDAGADRGRYDGADGAVDVAAILHRLGADAGVDVLAVVVAVVGVDLVVAPPGVVLGQAGVAREQRVGGDACRVVEELVVVRPDRVARGPGVAERVVVAEVVADLDGVAHRLELVVVGVEVGS